MSNKKNYTIGIDARLWNETGVGRYIRNLIFQLRDIDIKNTYVLFVLKKDYENIRSRQKSNWKIVVADIHWHTIEEQIRLPQILYKENLDLVHFPYFSFPFLYKNPFVITIHDLIIHHLATGEASTLPPLIYHGKRLGYKFLMNYGARHAEKIITVSRTTKKEIIEHLHVPENKITVTYEGVEASFNSQMHSNKFDKHSSYSKIGKYFLYVGNAYPHKNLDRLLNAFSQFYRNSEYPEIKLIMIGKQDFFYKRLEKKIKELHLEQLVTHYQNISDEELTYLYQHALALILPSLMEGFGLPALEAMTNKCLVLASDIPALKEICGDSAIYFNPEDSNDIAEKLLDVYTNKDISAEKIISGFERSKEFSWRKMAQETIKIYESCIGL